MPSSKQRASLSRRGLGLAPGSWEPSKSLVYKLVVSVAVAMMRMRETEPVWHVVKSAYAPIPTRSWGWRVAAKVLLRSAPEGPGCCWNTGQHGHPELLLPWLPGAGPVRIDHWSQMGRGERASSFPAGPAPVCRPTPTVGCLTADWLLRSFIGVAPPPGRGGRGRAGNHGTDNGR